MRHYLQYLIYTAFANTYAPTPPLRRCVACATRMSSWRTVEVEKESGAKVGLRFQEAAGAISISEVLPDGLLIGRASEVLGCRLLSINGEVPEDAVDASRKIAAAEGMLRLRVQPIGMAQRLQHAVPCAIGAMLALLLWLALRLSAAETAASTWQRRAADSELRLSTAETAASTWQRRAAGSEELVATLRRTAQEKERAVYEWQARARAQADALDRSEATVAALRSSNETMGGRFHSSMTALRRLRNGLRAQERRLVREKAALDVSLNLSASISASASGAGSNGAGGVSSAGLVGSKAPPSEDDVGRVVGGYDALLQHTAALLRGVRQTARSEAAEASRKLERLERQLEVAVARRERLQRTVRAQLSAALATVDADADGSSAGRARETADGVHRADAKNGKLRPSAPVVAKPAYDVQAVEAALAAAPRHEPRCGQACIGLAAADGEQLRRIHRLSMPRCCDADPLSSHWMAGAMAANASLADYFFGDGLQAWSEAPIERAWRPMLRGCRIVAEGCSCVLPSHHHQGQGMISTASSHEVRAAERAHQRSQR